MWPSTASVLRIRRRRGRTTFATRSARRAALTSALPPTGDAAFASAAEAVNAAVFVQSGLARAFGVRPARLRCGVHVRVTPRRGDFFDVDLGRCKYLTHVGSPGQILVSSRAQEALEDSLPVGLGLRDLGLHRLRDLAEPEHIWQVTGPGLEMQFPSLKSLDSFRGWLPSQPNVFIGRETDLLTVEALVRSERVVTLVGTGGIGKTRLGLQAAAAVVDRFADGAWLIDLVGVRDRDALENAVVSTLGFRPRPGLTSRALVAQGLRDWEVLLLLDNCEHLLEPVGELVAELVERCPRLSVLATSRAPLRIPPERVRQVGPLLSGSDGPALFIERAARVRSGLRWDDEHARRSRGNLRAAGWDAAGHRAGGSTSAVDVAGRDTGAVR